MRKVIFMKKKVMSVLLAVSFVFGMAACSNKDAAESTTAQTTVAESNVKVVSLSPEVTEIIYALGAEKTLVGVSTFDDYPAEVADIPKVGDLYAMDVEAIVAVEPTVVIASAMIDDDTLAALNEYGIEAKVVTEGTSIDGMYALINEVATIVGAEDKAADLIEKTQADLDKINKVDSDASVYFVVSFGENGDWSAGAGSFIDSIITTAGATNATGDLDQWAMLDTETLLERDPDIIIVKTDDYDTFIATEPYSDLTAVKEGNVIAVDGNLFERQTPRNVEAVKIVAEAVADYEAAHA